MPALKAYLKAFNIRSGLKIGTYILQNVDGDHYPIITYRQYEYPIEMTFIPQNSNANPNLLLNRLIQQTSEHKIVYTGYGNPYESDFGTPKIEHIYPDGTVIISTVGNAYRV